MDRPYRVPLGALTREVGAEILALEPEVPRVLTLNATAAEVLRRCDGRRLPEEIATDLARTLGLDAGEAARATYLALRLLAAHGLVEPA